MLRELVPESVNDEFGKVRVPVFLGQLLDREVVSKVIEHLQSGNEKGHDVVLSDFLAALFDKALRVVVGAPGLLFPEGAVFVEILIQLGVLESLRLCGVQCHLRLTSWRLRLA